MEQEIYKTHETERKDPNKSENGDNNTGDN